MMYVSNLVKVDSLRSGDVESSGFDRLYIKIPGAPGTYYVEGVISVDSRFPQWNGHLIVSQKDEAKMPYYFYGYLVLTVPTAIVLQEVRVI